MPNEDPDDPHSMKDDSVDPHLDKPIPPDAGASSPRKSLIAAQNEYVAPPPDLVLPKVGSSLEPQAPRIVPAATDKPPGNDSKTASDLASSPVIELAPIALVGGPRIEAPSVAVPVTAKPDPVEPSPVAEVIPLKQPDHEIQPPLVATPELIPEPASVYSNRWGRYAPHIGAHAITWMIVALMLCAGALWAFRAGMDLRAQVWQGTRSIRFKEDIRNGFTWGEQVMRDAEEQAGLQPMADAFANQPPKILAIVGRDARQDRNNPAIRRLTYREIIRGIVHRTDSLVQEHPEGDYHMDYPPIRLAVMTFWVRSVQRSDPRVTRFPMERFQETVLRQPEDIALPMLKFNAYSAAEAAVALFFLVWLWVWRSSKAPIPSACFTRLRGWLGRPQPQAIVATKSLQTPAWRWTVPHWMVAFLVATAGFWYAFVALASPPPRPAPAISIYQIHPRNDHADIAINLNAQNIDTNWHIDFGPTDAYGQSTPSRPADASADDQRASGRLTNLNAGQTVHLRISATNANGTTNTDDFSFKNDGDVIRADTPMSGGIQWPGCTVWLRMLVLFIIMVASAQSLPPIHRGWACGAVAALLLWFDPTLLLDGHAWPQWDAFVLPVFVTAALLASLNFWTTAGILIGAGCLFKGQLLLGGPVLILWPLLGGRFGPFLRILTGVALGVELITWPWLVHTSPGLKWIETVMLAAEVILIASFFRKPIRQAIQQWIVRPLFGKHPADTPPPSLKQLKLPLCATGGAIVAIIISAILVRHGTQNRGLLPSGAMKWMVILVIIPPWFLRRRSLPFWLAGVFALSIFLSALMFGGSFSWVTLGFQYGSVKHDAMQMSFHSLANLPAILGPQYNWDIHDPVGTLALHFTTPGPWRFGPFLTIPSFTWNWSNELDVKATLALLYGICLVICSLGAAVHARRNDVRFLVAIIAPWALFPQLMCQMGDRYMVWAAALSAALVAVSTGLSLLHIVLTLFSMGMIARHLLSIDSNRWPDLLNFLTPVYPGAAWMMLLITLVLMVSAVLPTRGRSLQLTAES